MPHEEIALGLGISRNTLEKVFERELSIGAAQKRLEVLDALHRSAKKGRVAAIKAYLEEVPQVATPPAPKPDAKPEPKAPPVGKKEQAAADAKTAADGTEWHEVLPRHTTTH